MPRVSLPTANMTEMQNPDQINAPEVSQTPHQASPARDSMPTASAALQELHAGNRRFLSGETTAATDADRRAQLVAGQQPFAVILGCADSRVPIEHVFDQGPGALFVIRIAGNIATPASIGSTEYAVANCGTRLIVVMGHTHCGAVTAALEEVLTGKRLGSSNLGTITGNIRPVVEPMISAGSGATLASMLPDAIRANIRAVADALHTRSPLLRQAIQNDDLRIATAEYALQTGIVTFLDDAPDGPVQTILQGNTP